MQNFDYFIHAVSEHLPDWRELRQYGVIAEMSALIAHPDVRGKINFGIIWQRLKQLLRKLGSDYVMVNGYMASNAHILYAGLGFKPLTPPLYVDFILARNPNIQPIAMPMLASVRDGVELPPCVLDLELLHVKQ